MLRYFILLILLFNVNAVYSQLETTEKYPAVPTGPVADKRQINVIYTNQEPVGAQTNLPAVPEKDEYEYIIITNITDHSTNRVIITNKKTSHLINLGFFFLLAEGKYKNAFSRERYNDNYYYYHLPYNSWNDSLYLFFSVDWPLKFINLMNARWGWSIGVNLAGSGGDDRDSAEVMHTTDLGKVRNQYKPAYIIYNNYKFPILLNLRFHPVHESSFKLYFGGGAGVCLHIVTYNELVEEERTEADEPSEKTFFPIRPIIKIFFGISFKTFSFLKGEMFLEVNYRYTESPILTNNYLDGGKTQRSFDFQTSGLSLGFGFRY